MRQNITITWDKCGEIEKEMEIFRITYELRLVEDQSNTAFRNMLRIVCH